MRAIVFLLGLGDGPRCRAAFPCPFTKGSARVCRVVPLRRLAARFAPRWAAAAKSAKSHAI